MSSGLQDRVVIITGAGGATGRAAARAFAAQGARLVLIGREAGKLHELAASLNLPAERTLALDANLVEPAAARAAAGMVQAAFGRADVLVHLVGGWIGGKTLVETPAEDLEAMLAQHAWSTFNTLQAFTPLMLANAWGRVLVVSSLALNRPPARMAAYLAAKAAQEALVLSLAAELKDQGVTANILQVRAIAAGEGSSGIQPAEIVAALLYLCSPEAAPITAARLPIG